MSNTAHAPQFVPPTVEELDVLFPSYTVKSFIAQGGMGAVYLGEQISLERPVAIKILPREFSGDSDYVASFQSEAKAMATVSHSNLVGIFDFGSVDDMLYIIMEYVPGRALFDVANGKAVDELEAANLICEMSRGLSQAHNAGIIHRDIKPANVLIDDKGNPKIVDFGLAKPHGNDHQEGVIFGTPGYTAPEVVSNPNAVDQKSDLYSMGVMLYELLTGTLPSDPYICPSEASGCDPRFDVIVAKALQRDPADRTESANSLIKELEKVIRNFGEPAPTQQGPKLVTAARGKAAPLTPKSITTLKSSKSNSGRNMLLLLVIFGVGGYLYWDKIYNADSTEILSELKFFEGTTETSNDADQGNKPITSVHQFTFNTGPKQLKDSIGSARIFDGTGVVYNNGSMIFNADSTRAPRILVNKKSWEKAQELSIEFWATWDQPGNDENSQSFFSISSKQGKKKDTANFSSITLSPNHQGGLTLRISNNETENVAVNMGKSNTTIPFPVGEINHVVVTLKPSDEVCQVYLDGNLVIEQKTGSLTPASLSEGGLSFTLGQAADSNKPNLKGTIHQLNIHHAALNADQIKNSFALGLIKDTKE